jgi:hypothetical protein
MTGYRIDRVGALSAGLAAGTVIFFMKTVFPRLTGCRSYLVIVLLIAAAALAIRELLRRFGI